MDKILQKNNIYFGEVTHLLKSLLPSTKVIVITDENIKPLYLPILEQFTMITIPSGENNKTLNIVSNICDCLIKEGADRTTFLLGFGGGIVTDITGFVASIFMRGIRFGFVSTTLLGQVDASVGGKNGVNMFGYKNMIGCFNTPEFVICDVSLLKTLPINDFRSGIAEVIKSAIIGDKRLFHILQNYTTQKLQNNTQALTEVISRALIVKCKIIAKDPKEQGLRRVLNLGHTIGHALEKCGVGLNHGQAIAVGIGYMATWANRKNMLLTKEYIKILSMLYRYEFDLTFPCFTTDIAAAICKDKKRENALIHIIVPTAIGKVEQMDMNIDEIESKLLK